MIYFDNAATTRALPSVAEKMTMMLCEQYGNPASVSAMGLAVEKEIRNAADIIARGIRAKNEEIFEFFSDAKDAGPIEFLLRIKDCNNWNIEEVGNFSCPDLS